MFETLFTNGGTLFSEFIMKMIKILLTQCLIKKKVGEELERMHPTLYTNVTRQITRPSSSDLQSGDTAPAILSAVARDLFRDSNAISWGKVCVIQEFNPIIKYMK